MQRNPFKFLDSFTKEDFEIFFGREAESDEIHSRLLANNLLLVYGPSGSGKSSILQCGVSNHFSDTDWKPIFVRRKDHIVKSIHSELNQHCLTPFKEKATFSDKVYSIYLDFLTPVYLILDQFEELFIFGDSEEKKEFAEIISDALSKKESIGLHVILIIREEYLARLTELEEMLPDIFQNRIRIEKMKHPQAVMAIENPCKYVGVKIDSEVTEGILEKLYRSGELELSYLQVYLDKLYKNALKRKQDPVEISLADVEEVGEFGDILQSFLEEQITISPNPELYRALLKTTISPQGTKKIISIGETLNSLQILGYIDLTEKDITAMLNFLVDRRIMKEFEKGGFYELRHDSLADKIKNWLTPQEKEFIEIQHSLSQRLEDYTSRGLLLDEQFLEALLPYENKFAGNPIIKELIQKSKFKIHKQKRARINMLGIAIGSITLLLLLIGFSYLNLREQRKTEVALTEAEKQRKIAEIQKDSALMLRSISDKLRREADSLKQVEKEARKDAENEKYIAIIARKDAENEQYKAVIARRDAEVQKIIAEQESDKANQNLALYFLEKAKNYSKENELQFVKLYGMQSFICQSKTGNYLPMNEIELPIGKQDWILQSVIKSPHNEDIYSIIYSPDEKFIATCGTDSTIKILDSRNNEFLYELPEDSSEIKIICFSPDGKYIASANDFGRTIKIWDVMTRRIYKILVDGARYLYDEPSITSLCFSPDGKYLASCNDDGNITVFDVDRDLKVLEENLTYSVNSVAFSPCGNLFVASGDEEIKIWKITDYQDSKYYSLIDSLSVNYYAYGRKSSITISPDCKLLVYGNEDFSISIFDLENDEYADPLKGHTGEISSLKFSSDGKYLFSCGYDNRIKVWNTSNWKILATISSQGSKCNSFTIDNDGENLLIANDFAEIESWKLLNSPYTQTLFCRNDFISSLNFSDDDDYLYVVGNDIEVNTWRRSDWARMKVINEEDMPVISIDITENQSGIGDKYLNKIEITGGESTTNIWKTLNWHDKTIINEDIENEYSIIFSGDKKYLAYYDSKSIMVYNLSTNNTMVDSIDFGDKYYWNHDINAASFSSDNKYLAWSDYSSIYIWELPKNKKSIKLQVSESVSSLCFSSDNKYLASGNDDGTIDIWIVDGWKKIRPLKYFQSGSYEYAIGFSPDNQYFTSGNSDGSITIWTVEGWEMLCTMKLACESIQSLSFSHDGELLAAGSGDGGIIKIFDLNFLSDYLWVGSGYGFDEEKIDEIVEKNQKETGYRLEKINVLSKDSLSFAKNYHRTKNYEEALDYFEKIKENSPSKMDDESLYELGMLYYNNSRYDEAIKLLESLKPKYKEDAEFWYYLASAYYDSHIYKDASGAFEKVIELDPSYSKKDTNLYFSLGYCYSDSAILDYKKSIYYYNKDLAYHQNATTINNLGVAYYYLNDYQEALVYIRQAVKISKKIDILLNFNLSELYLVLKKPDSAYYYYKQVIDSNLIDKEFISSHVNTLDSDIPDDPDLHILSNFFKGYLLTKIEEYSQALNYLKTFLNDYKKEDKWIKLATELYDEADIGILIQDNIGDLSYQPAYYFNFSTKICAAAENSLLEKDTISASQLLEKAIKIHWEDSVERLIIYDKYISLLYLKGDYNKALKEGDIFLDQDKTQPYANKIRDLQFNILLDQGKTSEAELIIEEMKNDSSSDYFRYYIDKAMIFLQKNNEVYSLYYFKKVINLISPFEYVTLWQYLKTKRNSDDRRGTTENRVESLYMDYFNESAVKENLFTPEEFSTLALVYKNYGNDRVLQLLEEQPELKLKFNAKNPSRIKTYEDSDTTEPVREPRFSPLPEFGDLKDNISNSNLEKGLAELLSADFYAAIETLTRSTDNGKIAGLAYLYRGLAYYFLCNYNKAISDFNESIKLDRNNYAAYINIGNINYLRQDFTVAQEYYLKALKYNPVNFRIFYNRGLAKACLQDYEVSVEDFDKGIKTNTLNPEIIHIRGLAKDYLNDLKGALYDYYQAIELNPDFTEAKNHFEIAKGKFNSNE